MPLMMTGPCPKVLGLASTISPPQLHDWLEKSLDEMKEEVS